MGARRPVRERAELGRGWFVLAVGVFAARDPSVETAEKRLHRRNVEGVGDGDGREGRGRRRRGREDEGGDGESASESSVDAWARRFVVVFGEKPEIK
jgi:hypothetical protein